MNRHDAAAKQPSQEAGQDSSWLAEEGSRLARVTPPSAIDLFSGAGGLAEGLESAGVKVAAAVELHPQPALTHALNHPGTDVFAGDIRMLDLELLADSLERRTGTRDVDVVVGGPPCQGFSTAGKKQANDPRNDLFTEFVRVVALFSPSVFVLENVPGFKTMHGGQAYAEATRMFRELGYRLDDRMLNAPAYGAPQRRGRFVLVGVREDIEAVFEWPSESHYDPAGTVDMLSGNRLPFATVEDALEDIAFLEPGWEAHRHRIPAASSFAEERRAGSDILFNHLATRHRPAAIETFKKIGEGQTIASVPKDERPKKATMARMARSRISNAVLALPDDMIHYRHHRIPTVREMARLQTFDDDYVFMGKRTSGFVERRVDVPQYTQVGNAVPPLLGRALGLALLALLAAPAHDVRDIDQRRERHAWIRGSSGFSGYTLDSEAEDQISLFGTAGRPLPLPISDEDMPVVDRDALEEWKRRPAPRRGQWVPDTLQSAQASLEQAA
jgi:DNA (cytosine-5)-methyltransferase 1